MSGQSQISEDTEYIQKTNELRDLQQELEKTRTTVYLLLAIVFLIIGLVVPMQYGLIALLCAIALMVAALTAFGKKRNLSSQIFQLEREIASFRPVKRTGNKV